MNQRYYSLDVFRGMTVALMILVNTPGTWAWIYPPLRHAEWHGLTPTDLVFPFFLFAVGNAMAFVMPKLEKQGDIIFWRKVIKRTALIFLIGLALNWFPFVQWKGNDLINKPWSYNNGGTDFGGVRILGVLQRIAICYFFASIIVYYLKRKGAILAGILLLLVYWAICYFGNPSDPYSLTGWIGTGFDQIVLGKEHMYFSEVMHLNDTVNANAWAKTIEEIGTNKDIITKPSGKNVAILFDPEGLLSTISAIAQVIFGYIVGKFILDNGTNRKTVEQLLIIGLILGIIGTIWHQFFPVNKKIWSSSYTVLTTGMATLFLAIFIYLFEIVKVPPIFGKFFDAFGKNPLFIFVLSGALPRLVGLFRVHSASPFNNPEMKSRLTSPFTWFYENVCYKLSSNFMLTSFIYAIIMILFYWLIAYIMDRRKIYVKV